MSSKLSGVKIVAQDYQNTELYRLYEKVIGTQE